LVEVLQGAVSKTGAMTSSAPQPLTRMRTDRTTALRAAVPVAIVLAMLLSLLPAAPAAAASVYPGSQYREEFFFMDDPLLTRLHADVLRDADVPWTVEQPVILVVSPYTNHSSTADDPLYSAPFGSGGMHERFFDFLDVTDALFEGYTFVQVDLPGFGGSSGCNDWGGPVEQGAVKAAVEWAARQPWSTGRVGMLGKSYDAWTGLMGMAQDAVGLEAVISMEPVFSGYRYGYNNGVRFLNSVATPTIFTALDVQPAPFNASPDYLVGSTPQAYCYGTNLGLQQQDREDVAFWAERDLVRLAARSDIPLFLTQGWLETNTKPDAALEFWNGLDHRAGHNHLWLGQFDHVRGYELQGDRFATGREVFADQAMQFLDQHLKGVGETDFETVAVQDNLGRYRAEASYPPADAVMLTTALNTGTYGDGTGGSLFSVSAPLEHDVWLAGEPVISAAVTTTVPRGNLTVKTYDLDPDAGTRTLIHRGTSLIRSVGDSQVDITLYGQDWVLPEGHRLAVEITATDGFWVHVPTGQDITVSDVDIAFPFLTEDRTEFLDGTSTPRLEAHLRNNQADLAAIIDGNEIPFTLPGPLD
jgi:uncharacterized protein